MAVVVSGFALGFGVGAVLATIAPFAGALIGAVLHERNAESIAHAFDWED